MKSCSPLYHPMRRALLTVLLAATSLAAQAEAFPARPITLVVPFPAGGTTDYVARVVADRLGQRLGKAIVIDNKPGAGGSIGMGFVARSAADGYTLGMATVSTHVVNPACNAHLPYDADKSLRPITNLANTANVLTVRRDFAASDARALLDMIQRSPGKLSFASTGTCSGTHIMAEQFQVATGTSLVHVPYKGAGPALNDLMGGQVNMMFDNLPSSMPYIKSGKLRALAIAWPKRLPALPDVPTFAELGLKAVNDGAWYGLVAPAGTPDAIVQRIQAEVAKVLAEPALQERLRAAGAEPAGNTPERFAADIQAERGRIKALVAKQGIKLEN